MAEYSGFFNSVGGDRPYGEEFFAKFFGSFIGNGIFPNPSTGCQIMANDNMTITFKTGEAWIKGRYYYNDEDTPLALTASDAVLKRIDRIVLRYSTTDRNILVKVKQGTFASSPTAPTLQRDDDYYELGLADIFIGNNAVSISQGNITDLRLNTTYCGVVHGLVDKVDTTTLFNQYLAKYAEIEGLIDTDIAALKAGYQSAWTAWFNGIEDILDANTAGNLYNLINSTKSELITKIDNEDTSLRSLTEAHKALKIQTEINGVHGIKIENRLLKFLDPVDSTWKKVWTGQDVKLGNVTYLTAAPRGIQILQIKWTDPNNVTAADGAVGVWSGTMVRYKLGGYPADENDGTLLVDSKVKNQYSSTGFMHTNVTAGVPIYYAVFPYTVTGAVTNDYANRVVGTPTSIPMGLPIEEWTWAQIKAVAEAGTASTYFSLGDTKNVLFGSETITMQIVGFMMDTVTSGGAKAGITFASKELMSTMKQMNTTGTTVGSWNSSALKTYLTGTVYPTLPADLKTAIKAVNKLTTNGNGATTTSTTSESLTLLSASEVYGLSPANGINISEGAQYPYFSTDATRTKKLSNGIGSAMWWWTRSPATNASVAAYRFIDMEANGTPNAQLANSTGGLCVSFCV